MTDYLITPYVYVQYAPKLQGRARQFSVGYRGHRVVRVGKTLAGEWSLSPNCIAVRVIRDRGGLYTAGPASAGRREQHECAALAARLNAEYTRNIVWA